MPRLGLYCLSGRRRLDCLAGLYCLAGQCYLLGLEARELRYSLEGLDYQLYQLVR